jgi:prefoldin subunit 1
VQVYESAGRMFLLSDIKTVRSGLDRKSEAVKEKVTVFLLIMIVILVLLKVHTLIGNKEYLEKQIKESENNLRELVMAKKNSSS